MRPLSHALTRAGFLVVILVTAGCAARYSFNAVEIAKTALLDMDQKDIRMCAGFPNRSFTEDEITIWSYDGPSRSGGVNVSAPILFGAANTNLSLPGNGSCRVQLRFVDGKVDRLAYSGDNDGPRGRNTVCTPVVDGCVDYARTYRKGRMFSKRTALPETRTEPAPSSVDLGQTSSIPRSPEVSPAAPAVVQDGPTVDEQAVRGN